MAETEKREKVKRLIAWAGRGGKLGRVLAAASIFIQRCRIETGVLCGRSGFVLCQETISRQSI